MVQLLYSKNLQKKANILGIKYLVFDKKLS